MRTLTKKERLMVKIVSTVAAVASATVEATWALSSLHNAQPSSGACRSISNLGIIYLRSKLERPADFRRIYRMYPDSFLYLCQLIRERGHLCDTRFVSVEEMIAVFLLTVGQNQRYSVSEERFDRSRWTVSINFNEALRALVALAPLFMAEPEVETPAKVMSNARYIPYFKDCVGVIDGTHIPAMVNGKDVTRYRNRHDDYSQNVLAACTFDLRFIYVLAGWEGSANDARVLKDAISRPHGLPLPNGKFYLVDCGYPNRKEFLAPYRGTRYHLKEFGPPNSQSRPRNAQEVFNLRHASLRNAIERIFGVFKSRLSFFKTHPQGFPYRTKVRMVWACAGLHNFLRGLTIEDEFPPDPSVVEAPRNIPTLLDDDSDEDDDLQT